ncbi:MAG: glycosyl transferase [Candidatus Dojkabacteria bacterium]|nr:MAG: glycosyl transferase [Candidatus Dojkabacteria bacterium]GIW61571.1 MAG: glycosyl transferase [Patescibacteria group bacterium]
MKVALVYDRVNKWGGAERVLLALHELFPQAPLFTSVYNSATAPWAGVFDIKTSFLQKFPFAKKSHELYPLLMPIAFESFTFDEFDIVISVASEAAKGIITKPSTLHICYCLTPTRYLWSGYEDYFSNPLIRFLSLPAVAYLKTWDKIAATRPDVFIAISSEVQSRIKQYYQRDAQIIYPPVTLFDNYEIVDSKVGDYFLVVSRLVAYKRIDLAIKACNELKVPLKIIGIGKEEAYLRSIAGPTVDFLGSVTDEELASYYQNCRALLFPGREDFGIVMVEAMGFGKPVIAYKGGGALDIIQDRKTGVFFKEQTVKDLADAINAFYKISFDSHIIQKRAKLFSKQIFQHSFMEAVENNFAKMQK